MVLSSIMRIHLNFVGRSVLASAFWILLVRTLILSSQENDETLESFLERSCHEKLDFKTIREFNVFVVKFRSWSESHKTGAMMNRALQRCLDDAKAIYDLEKLVRNYDKSRPCKYREVGKLEQYANDFLSGSRRPLSVKFFTLFGANVGFHCMLNLLAHIKQADREVDQVDFIHSLASPLGWNVMINEYTKKSLKFGVSSHSGSDVINRVARLIPGLSQLEQLDYLHFKHPKDKLPERVLHSDSWRQGIEEGELILPETGPEMSERVIGFARQIIEACRRLDQFYLNSILALARLNSLGLLIEFGELNDLHENSHMLHKWLAAASFCQLMVRVRVDMEGTSGAIKLQVLHDDQQVESRRQLYSYMAPFDEIDTRVLEKVWMTRLMEASWRQNSGALFKAGQESSVPMRQVKKFLQGLARDYSAYVESLA